MDAADWPLSLLLGHPAPNAGVADYCTAPWSNFAPPLTPKTLERFHKEIKLHQEDVKKYGRAKQSQKYNNAKNDARKFLEQGRKVLANVAKGQFPGSY